MAERKTVNSNTHNREGRVAGPLSFIISVQSKLSA